MVVHSDYVHDNRVRREAEYLASEGYKIVVLAASHQPEHTKPFTLNQVDVTPVPLRSKGGKFKFFQMMSVCGHKLSKIDARVIHAHDLDGLVASVLFNQPFEDQKIVYDSHELYIETHSVYNRKFTKWLWTILEANTIKRAHSVITVSTGIASYLQQRYKLSNLPHVLRNFTDLPNKEAEAVDVSRFKLPKTKRIGVYQGVLQQGRGLDLLLKTLPETEWGLLICGDGPMRASIEEIVERKNLKDRVTLTGRIKPAEVFELMKSCDAGFILTQAEGLSHEFSLPNKLTEYIHAGIPLITTPLPEIKRLVETHKIGKTAKTKEELVELLKTFPKKQTFADNLAKASKELNWQNEKEVLLKVYRDL